MRARRVACTLVLIPTQQQQQPTAKRSFCARYLWIPKPPNQQQHQSNNETPSSLTPTLGSRLASSTNYASTINQSSKQCAGRLLNILLRVDTNAHGAMRVRVSRR